MADVFTELNELAALVEEARISYSGHPSSGTFRAVGNRLAKITAALSHADGQEMERWVDEGFFHYHSAIGREHGD